MLIRYEPSLIEQIMEPVYMVIDWFRSMYRRMAKHMEQLEYDNPYFYNQYGYDDD